MTPAIESSAIGIAAPRWGLDGADYPARFRVRPPRLPPTASWLVVRIFFETFIAALGTFLTVDLLASFIDKFDDLMSYGLFRTAGLEYLLLKLPLMTSQLLPVAALAGVLLGMAMLNRSGELLALQGLGISRWEIAFPLLMIAGLLSMANFGLNETIVPAATRRSKYLLDGVIHNDPYFNQSIIQNWVRTRDSFIGIQGYDLNRKRLVGIRVFQIGPQYALHAIYSATTADWNGTDWIFSGLKTLDVKRQPDQRQSARQKPGSIGGAAAQAFHLDAKPGDFAFVILSPEEFSLSDLNAYIAKLRRNGLDPGSYFVDRDVKYALPFSCLVLVFCGLALSLDPVPRGTSAGRGFILGLGVGLTYWIILGFTIAFGRSGILPPWLAAWLPNLLFSLLGASLFLTGEER